MRRQYNYAMAKASQATIIPSRTLGANARRRLSESWKKAAGMLRHHKPGLDRYISRVRKEWK